ncbi:hypothetical protein PSQ19_07935 [Devosia algicola]|uniref:Uncharacterized protein n=1 Tax=Devosia algicola TaxID=3026418 RepID=A0ABY7YRW1_9HYPH|nr:hypothetical protein [Devosia algicola]WDR03942.1 hypothetical protein PSQ19_07935 [Devosia algicola]
MAVVGKYTLGVTVMPEYVQSEGAEAVLDRLVGGLGANQLTTSPYVAAQTQPGEGLREPPADAGAGAVRILDRPLWGANAVFMRASPSFVPDDRLYANIGYAPQPADDLTRREGHLVGDFVSLAKKRGVEVYLQIMAAIPPCLRVQFGGPSATDEPMLPDGRILPQRVDKNASLAARGVRDYMRALIVDLSRHYPDVDAFKFDWPEYPPYHFLALFADYNPQVRPYAVALGLDFDPLAEAMSGLLEKILGGNLPDLGLGGATDFDEALAKLTHYCPAVADHLALRTHLVERYAAFLRQCVDEASGGTKKVILQGFPTPWDQLSGFAVKPLSRHAHGLAVKFYTMHWPMMLANYASHLVPATPDQDMAIAAKLSQLFLARSRGYEKTGDFIYPEPGQGHGITAASIATKLAPMQAAATVPIAGISHAYGPISDVVDRFKAVWDASGRHAEINRYCYMSDAKIDALAAVVSGSI